ncbi:MAG: hypothetical protein KatS3mg105_0757 [Gemmatales bacterium]|nr:MAG: hypothetical protein KatS3mg105_0757 [Gemmatales bacterium]
MNLCNEKRDLMREPSPINLENSVILLREIPMLPEVAIEALNVARDPDSSMRDLAKVIERDASLSVGVLRLVNSPLYRISHTIETVDQAVVRLGMRECQNLIITVSMRSLFRKIPASRRQRCETLWRHGIMTATLCRRLNEELALGFQGQEFAGGLCHDIGRILLAFGAPAHCDFADPLDFNEPPDLLTREEQVLGTDHCRFGAWYSNLNELPEALTIPILYHHKPSESNGLTSLVTLVAVADKLANASHRGESPDLEAILAELHVQENQFEELLHGEKLSAIMDKTVAETDGAVGFTK